MYDWCNEFDSDGVYYSSVTLGAHRGMYDDDAIGKGAFYFSKDIDATVFALKWIG